MINTKSITPQERKEKIAKLRKEHQSYFNSNGLSKALFIPKMAYRPSGKDELYISFFPSELENECNIYTEFVSIIYESEDLKRTLYLHKYNPHWKNEYELVESKSGFQRHLIPVSELKIINDVVTKSQQQKQQKEKITMLDKLEETPARPNQDSKFNFRGLIEVLQDINSTLQQINRKMIK